MVLSLRIAAQVATAKTDAAEAEIKSALEAGATVEPGPHTARLKESKRRNVSWKSIAERLARRIYGEARGAVYCARVLAGTKPSVSVSLEIQ